MPALILRAFAPVEPLQLFPEKTPARITDGKAQTASPPRKHDPHCAALRIVAHAVANQVFQHAAEQLAVAKQPRLFRFGRYAYLHRMQAVRILVEKVRCRLAHQRSGRKPFTLERLHGIFRPGGQVEVRNQAAKLLALLTDEALSLIHI